MFFTKQKNPCSKKPKKQHLIECNKHFFSYICLNNNI